MSVSLKGQKTFSVKSLIVSILGLLAMGHI